MGSQECDAFRAGERPPGAQMDRPQGPLHAPSRSGDPGASVRLTVCLLALLTFFIPVVRAAEPVKLNLWNIPPSWCWDPERKSQYKIFRRFLDLNPDIEVEQGQGLTILGPASQSSFLMAMAGGIAPDCFPTSLGNLPGYVEQGLVMPLDEFYAAWPDKDRIPQMFIDAATIDGRLYGIVVNTGALALIYRKDFFEDVGLDPDRPPQDWDELVKYSAMLTDPDQGRFGFGCRPEEIFINFLWQAGGDIVRKRPDGTLEAALDTPEAAKALAFVKRLKFEGHMRLPTQAFGASNDMAEGKVAMVYARPETDYQYLLSKLQEYQIGITALPAGPAGRVTAVGGEVWCINGTLNPKNPDERRRIEAAWRYISFLASREAARIRTQTYVERNGAEFLSPADLREFGFEYAVERIDPSLRDLHENIYKYGRVEPVFPGITEVGVIMRAPIEAVLADPNADPAGEMKAANDRINREVFVRRRGKTDVIKERIAVGVAALLGVLFIVFFVKALRAVAEKVRSETRVVSIGGASMRRRKHTVAWLLMLPALGSIALWSYIPLARGSVMAFQDYLLVGGGSFSGLRNFIDVFTNPMFYTVLFNTFYYVLLTLAIGFGIPIFLAILLAEVPRGKVLFRVLFFLPAVTSGLVIMFLWRWFYDPTEAGLFNTLLMQAGAIQNPIGWLQDRRLAMLCIILPGVWAGAGPGSIIYIAALKSVPNEIYEAADVDGAGTIRKVFHITLPYLKALIIINFVGAFIGAFHAMQGIFVMTGGGPENSTYTIGLDIYYNAFVYLRFGYATALAWVLGSMLIGFTMYQLRILKHVKFEAAKGE